MDPTFFTGSTSESWTAFPLQRGHCAVHHFVGRSKNSPVAGKTDVYDEMTTFLQSVQNGMMFPMFTLKVQLEKCSCFFRYLFKLMTVIYFSKTKWVMFWLCYTMWATCHILANNILLMKCKSREINVSSCISLGKNWEKKYSICVSGSTGFYKETNNCSHQKNMVSMDLTHCQRKLMYQQKTHTHATWKPVRGNQKSKWCCNETRTKHSSTEWSKRFCFGSKGLWLTDR